MKELEKRIAALEEIVRIQGLTIARLQSMAPMPNFGPQYPFLPLGTPGSPIPPYVVTCGGAK